jgi:hypothetical protein
MKFEVLPTLDEMLELYSNPRNFERFQAYLDKLSGGEKGALKAPISGFNPMAKEHIGEKLLEFKALDAEQIVRDILTSKHNFQNFKTTGRQFKIAINIDLKGGWTNRYTSDYDSKFKLSGVFNHNFCTPFFWSSEVVTKKMIEVRVLEYMYRTIFWETNPKPRTLREHLNQEIFVSQHVPNDIQNYHLSDFEALDKFYSANENSDNYSLIFNFFYGDSASTSLEYPLFGTDDKLTGFDYAKFRAYMGV